mmetsp:Transcript_42242/g.116553  ORF Transcript_42242/g.116553 Transcript_42242/m.116553 type:complete len:191 (-) Transcript_42242:648-1220(-)
MRRKSWQQQRSWATCARKQSFVYLSTSPTHHAHAAPSWERWFQHALWKHTFQRRWAGGAAASQGALPQGTLLQGRLRRASASGCAPAKFLEPVSAERVPDSRLWPWPVAGLPGGLTSLGEVSLTASVKANVGIGDEARNGEGNGWWSSGEVEKMAQSTRCPANACRRPWLQAVEYPSRIAMSVLLAWDWW